MWYSEWGMGGQIQLCNHWRDPVAVGAYTVYASGNYGAKKEAEFLKNPPDFGFYMSESWLWDLTPAVGVGIELDNTGYYDWPFLVFDWPDMGVLDEKTTNSILDFLQEKIKTGERVEVGCMGAHGRTGTLLSMLRVRLAGMGAAEAINTLRDDYCSKVVESNSQIDAVYKVAGEEPPKHKPKATKAWASTYLSCDNCNHSSWSHERGKDIFNTERCAHMKFGAKEPWQCDCTQFLQLDNDEIMQLGFDSGEEWAEHAWKMWPHDTCYCSHDRDKHESTLDDSSFCKNCSCLNFKLEYAQ